VPGADRWRGGGGRPTDCPGYRDSLGLLTQALGAAGAQLVGVCDLDRERAERNARRFGGRPYDNLERMLDAEAPDAVLICIGPRQRAERAPIVMRRGIPVYTEKPPAPDAGDGARRRPRLP
jgi:predicted dehydrogenase